MVPLQKGDIEAIEKVQKRATKLVISLKKLPYKERLLQLNLHTLKYRRLRGDMIEVYKIIHDMYDRSVALELPRNVSSTRGNKNFLFCSVLSIIFWWIKMYI